MLRFYAENLRLRTAAMKTRRPAVDAAHSGVVSLEIDRFWRLRNNLVG